MEYLIVKYPKTRGVLVDGTNQGQTNQIIELEAGIYTITLEGPANFSPKTQDITLTQTTSIRPAKVKFV